jgi:hypothetical protein
VIQSDSTFNSDFWDCGTLCLKTALNTGNIPCCAAGARNICVRFADVTRMPRESGAYVTQMLRAKFAYDVRHVTKYAIKRNAVSGLTENVAKNKRFICTTSNCSQKMWLTLILICRPLWFVRGENSPREGSRNGHCLIEQDETRPPLHIHECWSQLSEYLKVEFY